MRTASGFTLAEAYELIRANADDAVELRYDGADEAETPSPAPEVEELSAEGAA